MRRSGRERTWRFSEKHWLQLPRRARIRWPKGRQRGQGSSVVEAGAEALEGAGLLHRHKGAWGAEDMGWLGDLTGLEVVRLRIS